jgi:hypothetical protein
MVQYARARQGLGSAAGSVVESLRRDGERLPVMTRSSHLSKGQLVDIEGRLQTRPVGRCAGKRHLKTAVDRFCHHKPIFAPATGM